MAKAVPPSPRILIVAPVPKEVRALAALFAAEGCAVCPRESRVESFEIPTLGVLCAAAGHGKARFALTTQWLIDTEGPFGAIVVAGASGALSTELRPGDVIVGTEAVEHDYKPRFGGNWPPPRHPASSALVDAILAAQPGRTDFHVHTGPIAGGDEDIVDAGRAAELTALTGALCVAWEGAGGARAAAFNGLPFVEIRAVTDAADGTAAQSYRVHLSDAVGNVGRVLLAWLEKRGFAGTSPPTLDR